VPYESFRQRLSDDLPAEEAFAVGFDDGLSEHFGDGMFVFQFFTDKPGKDGQDLIDLLVIRVTFVQT
jgi:hypothetical protein